MGFLGESAVPAGILRVSMAEPEKRILIIKMRYL